MIKQHPILLTILMLVCCYLLGAIFAYPLYLLLADAESGDFHRYARHTTLLFGLIISWLMWRSVSNHNRPLFNRSVPVWAGILQGVILGCLLFACIESLLLLLGIRALAPDQTITLSFIGAVLLKGLVTGLLVSLLEEMIFRRHIYNTLQTRHDAWLVIPVSAGLYAIVHFIDFPPTNPSNIDWFTGLQSLPEAFSGLLQTDIWDTFLTLFLLGCLLGIFRARYHSIAYCIGIHAGVVAGVKLSRKLTEFNADSNLAILVNQTDRQQGLLASVVLFGCCVGCYWWLFIRRPDRYGNSP